MGNTANRTRRAPLWLWLCYGLLLVLAFTGSSFAAYKTTASGSDSARVAAFRYAAAADSTQETAITLAPTDAAGKSYAFTVSNAQNGQVSEVAQKYYVLVSANGKTAEWLPTGVTVKIGDVTGDWSTADAAYRFDNSAWQFAAGTSGTADLTLTFTSNNATATTTPITSITITVVFEQLD